MIEDDMMEMVDDVDELLFRILMSFFEVWNFFDLMEEVWVNGVWQSWFNGEVGFEGVLDDVFFL